jgi:rapamycin-insensitive companion of mTOR
VKKKIDWRMDLAEFRQKLQLSGVLQTKEWAKWDWDVITEIVDGPLENPTLLQAALKTKFIKRLVSFLRPSNNAFVNIPRKSENSKYTQIACHLLEILVSDDDGRSFLNSNPLLPQVGDLFRLEAEPSYASSCKLERIFTKEKVLRTLSQDYFTIIGALSGSKLGLDFLHNFKLFEYLPSLCLLPDRHDLCTIIMTCVDYNVPSSPARLILQKALFSDNALVRFRATRHLQVFFLFFYFFIFLFFYFFIFLFFYFFIFLFFIFTY